MPEGYKGVLFTTIPVGIQAPTDARIEELRHWCEVFHTHNLAPPYPGGSYGNLSFRVRPGANGFVITTSKTGLNVLADNCFAEVHYIDLGRYLVYAICIKEKEPSSESMVHYAVYRERPDVGAVFHGHSPKILASANALGVPETEREVPCGTLDLVEEVLKTLNKENFLIMKNHGFLAFGKTMQEAGELAMQMHRQAVRVPGILVTF